MPKRPYGYEDDERDGRTGRYVESFACDCCGRPIGSEYGTDGEACGNGDGPGFLLCDRKSCGRLPGGRSVFDLPVEERRVHFRAQRKANMDAGKKTIPNLG